jgi:amidophosphoribosyltransferase
MGLVTDVLNPRTIGFLPGDLGIGHTRYSTTGGSRWENAQPSFRSTPNLEFALAHNGNLTNTRKLQELVGGSGSGASNDSDLIAELLALASLSQEGAGLPEWLCRILPQLEGAFSLVLMDDDCIVGVRDPNGFRPLCLGKINSTGWVIASETAALDAVGAIFVREILPGEMVVVEIGCEPRSIQAFPTASVDPRLCIFEFVYMARPDSQLYGREVGSARMRMGELLATKAPVDADMVMGVPDSGIPAAEGYAKASGIEYGSGLVKNRYIGRTFINPAQTAREHNARRKLNVLRERVAGKRLVVVEDSVVRGTTTRFLAKMLREAGATEVHLRVALPMVKWPCFYGIDIGTRQELLASTNSLDDIRELLQVDSLAYLSVGELRSAIGLPHAGFCDACMTDNYPTQVQSRPDKHMLEQPKSSSAVALQAPLYDGTKA